VKIRFQADADLNQDIVTGVLRREPRVDFRTAAESGLRSLSDPEVLTLAASAGRILVSHDRRTMPRAFADFVRSSTSPGVLIVSQKTDLLTAIEGVLLVWSASEAEEWTNQLGTIPF
jgi:predicted nuclease of predicted toxin-antitoxin system